VEGDPEATIRKMQAVRKAALAPAHPSAQDRSVASRASQQEAKARQEIMRQRSENAEANGNPSASEAQTTSGYRPDGRPAAISSLDAHLLDISA
jgi:predicted lipid-binding transport protein (Tim44 family)